jgi:hypothetical protein
MTVWVDYSGGRPGGAALKAAGITGAIRYVSAGSAGKLITAAEYADLVAHGLQVLLVYELGVHDAEGGYTQGAAHAQAALSTARAYGIPDSVGIAAAADEHLTAGQVPAAADYVRGFRDVLGQARTGAYGFEEFITAVHAAGWASWHWKCGSAPTAAERAWVTFWQRNTGQTTQTINGVVCDLNDQINPIGDDMPLTNDDIAAIWAYQFGGSDPLNNQAPMDAIAAKDWMATTNRWANAGYVQAAAVNGALPGVIAAVVAAVPAQGSVVSPAQMADLEAKLIAALPEGWDVAITPKSGPVSAGN